MPLPLLLDDLIDRALAEDLGHGDITTEAIIPLEAVSEAKLVVKAAGVLAGMEVAELVLRRLDPELRWEALVEDGAVVADPPQVVARLRGRTRAILAGERVALNLMQHLSGIATAAHRCVELVRDLPVTVIDTRKTTPGLRLLEKYAVRVGGASNHRFGLADGILIKDNHIRAAGGIIPAVQAARRAAHLGLRVEVEVTNLQELDEALEVGAELILLDNMPVAEMREAAVRTRGRALLEASGGITPETLRAVAETGVNYISSGALTHSVRALDISLKIVG